MSKDTKTTTRVEAISNAYNTRAKAVAAGNERELEREAAEKKAANARRAAADEGEQDGDELPDQSWRKGDIVDYLLRHGAIESEDDVKGQTKDDLLNNFVDAEG